MRFLSRGFFYFQLLMHLILNILIALVWLINGLLCKLLNLVPRHQRIVERILGSKHAFIFTKVIGVLEILTSVWILSGIQSESCAVFQVIIILMMNIIEFFYAKDLLLYGKMNIVIAFLLCGIIYINQFIL
ncbi:MAG TPA: DoxX-like family protein [Parafilimonas sp.]